MKLDLRTNEKPTIVSFSVTTASPKRVWIYAIDPSRPLTRYTDRYVNLKGTREFELKFPKTPANLVVFVTGQQGGDAGLSMSQAKIKWGTTCTPWLDTKTSSFIRFAQDFNEKASYLETGIYKSSTDQFLIKYLPTITDYRTGKQLNTPARIGHETGNIEVAKDKWMKYSIPMRMLILLHEYSHKYMNHKVGREINDEVAADINALYIYLGMGYPAMDARLVFAYVFYGNASDLNKRRMNIIDDYINRFQKGEVIKGCK